MKAIKKIIALIVALLIMSTTISFGIAGLSANAADELATNGQCGDNAFWNFEKSTGMLVISGKGFMWNYDNYLEIERKVSELINSDDTCFYYKKTIYKVRDEK